MTTSTHVRQTKTSNKRPASERPEFRYSLFTFVAALAGVAVGVVATLALVTPMVKSQFADASQKLSSQLAAMAPAATMMSCAQPSAGGGMTASGAPAVQTASVTQSTIPNMPSTPPTGGKGGGNTFVTKLVSGIWSNNTATLKNTGPYSTNDVSFSNTNTTTVSNTNDVKVTNDNPQFAKSGDATVSNNTTGGNATSGAATNTSDTDMTVNITN